LHPCQCRAGDHDEEECHNAEPHEPAQRTGCEAQQCDAEGDFGERRGEAGYRCYDGDTEGYGGLVRERDVDCAFAEAEVDADLGCYCFGEEEDLVALLVLMDEVM
jgi:hypothetical protein